MPVFIKRHYNVLNINKNQLSDLKKKIAEQVKKCIYQYNVYKLYGNITYISI